MNIEGRKAINILADAYSNALVRQENDMNNILITKEDIYTVAQVSRLTPFITKKLLTLVRLVKFLA